MSLYTHQDSIIERQNPLVKLICFFILLLTALLSSSYYYLFIYLFSLVILLLARLKVKRLLLPIFKLKWFFTFIIILNTLYASKEEILYSYYIFNISYQGFLIGLKIVLNCILVILLTNILTATTRTLEITNSLILLLKPLKIVHFPINEVAFTLTSALNFIPSLLLESENIYFASSLRGNKRRINMLSLVVPLFLVSFKKADNLALALESRGIRSARDISFNINFNLVIKDYLIIIFFITLLVGGLL